MPPEAPNDFAVSMHISEKHGVVFMITKQGFCFMFDISTGALLFRYKVSNDSVFIAANNPTNGGCIFVNRKGQVVTVTVASSVLVNYVMNQLVHLPNRQDLAFNLARRFGHPGADDLFQTQFSRFFAVGDYKNAAKIAAQAKSGALRTPAVIQQFKMAPAQPGQRYASHCRTI